MKRALRVGAWALAWLFALGCVAWAFGALSNDFPVRSGVVSWAFALVVLMGIVFARGPWRKLGAAFLGFALVLAWWLTLKPSNDRAWQPDLAQTAWAEVKGDEVTLHNVRNCDYRTETDYTPHWETRTVRLSQITGVDLAINYWGSQWMAHPIASFQFADAPPVCFSIETRKKVGQTYSAIGGLYRQFELIYVVADERDVIRLRTNYRQGEEIYLYRTTFTAAQARERFQEYLRSLNQIRDRPRWYNAVTTNCTTAIRDQHPPGERIAWDWRMLVNGKMDEMLYEHGIIVNALPFQELKSHARINRRARAANDALDFSARIRTHL